jgi:choline dehydrogenase-like flavoprotein
MTLVTGEKLSGRHLVDAEVCVIGSGAGGAPVAKELAEAGMRVVVVEEGAWWSPEQLTGRPRDMIPKLYRDAGRTMTVGSPPLVVPVGRAVGGTTLINSGTCFRPPPAVLERWRREGQLDVDRLTSCFGRVEHELKVARVTPALAGRNAEVIRRGAERLGWSGGYLHRNASGCVGSGVCAYGCPRGAKQHTGLTYMARALSAGATTFTGTHAVGIDCARGRVRYVIARTAAGGRIRVRCQTAVVAAGALHTPLLLRRLGVNARALGRDLSIHPATAVRARFEEEIRMWEGVPQSFYIDQFAGEGIMLEGIAGPPDYLALTTPRVGRGHRELMLDAARTASFGVMVCDGARGRVLGWRGRPLVRYSLAAEDARRFKRGLLAVAELYWAAGAHEVVVPVRGVPALHHGDSGPLQRHPVPPSSIKAMGFHPLGTARAGADPSRSVVDENRAVRGVGGLYVSDASAVPGPLGVNPQITIMALATDLARFLTR